jgi:hypothetical protein
MDWEHTRLACWRARPRDRELFFSVGTFSEQVVSKRKACFGATPKPTRVTRVLPKPARELHLHDLGFFVLEMIVDGFDEAIGELLHFILNIAQAVLG